MVLKMQEKWIRIQCPEKYNKQELLDWMEENIKSRYHYKPKRFHFTHKPALIGLFNRPYIKFEDPADAMAFKLRWL